MDPQMVDQAVFQHNLISNITSLAALGASIAAIVKVGRRVPPLSEQVMKDFATKEDLRELKSEVTALRTEINMQLRSGDKSFKDLINITGRLEGILERCPYMCGTPVITKVRAG